MTSIFRRPMACAPKMSDCIPMRFRSRQQKCRIASISAACWIFTAVTIGDRRELARGPSGMFIASIPISAHRRAFSRIGSMSSPFGGVISIVVTFWPLASLWPIFDFSDKKLKFVVREPYFGNRVYRPTILSGEIKDQEKIEVICTRESGSVLAVDDIVHELKKGDVVEVMLSEIPLNVIARPD